MSHKNTRIVRDELQVVEIEVNSRCNRRCSYCPVSLLPYPAVSKWMADETYGRILQQLQRIGYSGRISYHFYNEPLLRNDLESFVSRARQTVPEAQQVLFTNGDLLTDQRYASLIEAGIAFIVITSHGHKQHPGRPRQIVQFPEDLELTNRAGVLSALPETTESILRLPCYAPSEMLIITVTGQVVLCYEDAFRTTSFGNIMEQDIEDIWLSPALVSIRKALKMGDRSSHSELCKKCTNKAHTVPGKSARSEPFWESVSIV